MTVYHKTQKIKIRMSRNLLSCFLKWICSHLVHLRIRMLILYFLSWLVSAQNWPKVFPKDIKTINMRFYISPDIMNILLCQILKSDWFRRNLYSVRLPSAFETHLATLNTRIVICARSCAYGLPSNTRHKI